MKNNSNKQTKEPFKEGWLDQLNSIFTASKTTKAVVRAFLKTDSLLKLNRHGDLIKTIPVEALELIFQRELLPIFRKRLKTLRHIVDLTRKTLTMRDFRRICADQRIHLFIEEKPISKDPDPTMLGQYGVVNEHSQYIWIKKGLTYKQTLFVAAHELSHFLLHRESMLQNKRLPALHYFRDNKMQSDGKTFMEVEADMLASMLTTKVRKEVR